MRHGRDGAGIRTSEDLETGRDRFHLIPMIHPDLLAAAVQIGKQRMRLARVEQRQSVLAFIALADAPAQLVGHKLLAVANAQHRALGGKNGRIDARTAGLVDAVRASRNNEAAPAAQLSRGRLAGANVGVHAQIANFPGDEMTILTARVEHGDLRNGFRSVQT